jgi:hypothetical protein
MTTRDEALKKIVELATTHKITVREFSNAMNTSEDQRSSYGAIRRMFAYLSGISIFSGICAYINMFWHAMNSYERVIITLGSGIVLYVIAIVFTKDQRYSRAAAPLFQMAAVLQPTGLFVALSEWWTPMPNDNWSAFLVFGVMALQQGLTFKQIRISTLLFFTIAFGSLTFAAAFDIIGLKYNINASIIGLSLISLLYGINKVRPTSMTAFWYLIGSMLFLANMFDILQDTPFEVLYLGITCFMVYISVISHSRTLMTVSVGAMLSYIAYFTIQNFVDSIGWPITLILLGLLFSGISAEAWKIKAKYIKA